MIISGGLQVIIDGPQCKIVQFEITKKNADANAQFLSRIPDYQTRAIKNRLPFWRHSDIGYHLSRNSLNIHTQPVHLIPKSKHYEWAKSSFATLLTRSPQRQIQAYK